MLLSRFVPLFAFCALTASAQVSFDANAIDKTVSPCTDFYQYSCGNWLKNNAIPADRSSWGRFTELQERNQNIMRDILQTAGAKTSRSTVEQKIGDYYAACVDEKGLEAKGLKPIKSNIDQISLITEKRILTPALVRLHQNGIGAMFSMESGQDFKDATEVIATVDQGGLGLPERDYYFKDDPKSVEIRKAYVEHIAKMMTLLGHTPEKSAAEAQAVMKLETALAQGHLDITTRRDPAKVYHRLTAKELAALTPSIDWSDYFSGIGIKPAALNVAVPEFFKTLEAQINSTSIEDWRTYITWHVVHSSAAALPNAFVNEDFAFFGKTLTGQKELRPRWKRCVSYVDQDLGEALGQKYVELTFGAEGKDRMLKLVRNLEKALEKDITDIDWMTEDTKKRALEKLHAIANKIGFPEKWRDYGPIDVKKDDMLGNSLRSNNFEFRRQMAKIGKPVDKAEWFMTPPTVNAYYDPQNNNINFPAGILQPPFYDNKIDDAVNYGGIGAVIGHELTHGFDDQGSQFDAKGNFDNWWTEKDRKAFDERTACVDKQYGGFTAVDDLKLNGKLTLGENVADNGGLRIAYMALVEALGSTPKNKIDDFTPEQRFFLGWGQVWCTNQTDQVTRLRTQTDPHSPGKFRVNGTVSNMPEFQSAFSCKAGDAMVRSENACRVW